MAAILEKFSSLLDRGAPFAKSRRQSRQLRAANLVGLIFTSVSLPFVALFALAGAASLAAALAVACGLYISPLWLNKQGFFWLGRSVPLATACVVATTFAMSLGLDSNVHVTLFMLACWAFALFDARRELPSLLALTTIPALGFILVSSRIDVGIPKIELNGAAQQMMSLGGGITAFGMFVAVFTVLHRHDQRIEDRLRRTIRRLQREVTRRERAESEALVAQHRAEQAANVKNEFLSVISHELRTPLNGIIGATDLLGESSDPTETQELVGIIRTSGSLLLALIEDVLSFSTLEAGRVRFADDPVDLRAVVTQCVDSVCRDVNDKGLSLVVDIEPSVPHTVRGDSSRLCQILSNFLTNAVKFTLVGGVELRCMARTLDATHVELTLEVADTGIGVPADLREHIFEKFVQADRTHCRRFGGTGLGLAISKRLAEGMGGIVGVREGSEGGSCFWFRAPFRVIESAGTKLSRELRVHVSAPPAVGRSIEHALCALGATVVDSEASADVSFVAGGARSTEQSGRRIPIAEKLGAGGDSADTLSMPVRTSQLRRLLERVCEIEPRPRPGSLSPPSTTAAAPVRALVVEDNPVNQKILKRALAKLHVEVAVANDGAEGLSMWQQEHYALVLMDVQMPVMDGLEATRRIRSLGGEPRPTIVGVSANAYPSDVQAGLDAGMDAYITKPVKRDKLVALLTAIAKGASVQELSDHAAAQAVVPQL